MNKWMVLTYYKDDIHDGQLAIATKHTTRSSADTEVEASKRRKDIGLVFLQEEVEVGVFKPFARWYVDFDGLWKQG